MRRATLQYGQSYKKRSWSAEEGEEREVGQVTWAQSCLQGISLGACASGGGECIHLQIARKLECARLYSWLVVGLPNILVGKNCSHHVVETGENKRWW
jgi:hypothetical protein